MLRDATNTTEDARGASGKAPVKTFVRRAKVQQRPPEEEEEDLAAAPSRPWEQPAPHEPASHAIAAGSNPGAPAGAPQPTSSTTSSGPATAGSGLSMQQGSPCSQGNPGRDNMADGESGEPATDPYAWLRLRSARRSSVLPCPGSSTGLGGGLTQLVQQHAAMQQRGKGAAQRRALSVREVIQEMAAYFQEVDDYELLEESPDKAKAREKKASVREGRRPQPDKAKALARLSGAGAAVQELGAGRSSQAGPSRQHTATSLSHASRGSHASRDADETQPGSKRDTAVVLPAPGQAGGACATGLTEPPPAAPPAASAPAALTTTVPPAAPAVPAPAATAGLPGPDNAPPEAVEEVEVYSGRPDMAPSEVPTTSMPPAGQAAKAATGLQASPVLPARQPCTSRTTTTSSVACASAALERLSLSQTGVPPAQQQPGSGGPQPRLLAGSQRLEGSCDLRLQASSGSSQAAGGSSGGSSSGSDAAGGITRDYSVLGADGGDPGPGMLLGMGQTAAELAAVEAAQQVEALTAVAGAPAGRAQRASQRQRQQRQASTTSSGQQGAAPAPAAPQPVGETGTSEGISADGGVSGAASGGRATRASRASAKGRATDAVEVMDVMGAGGAGHAGGSADAGTVAGAPGTHAGGPLVLVAPPCPVLGGSPDLGPDEQLQESVGSVCGARDLSAAAGHNDSLLCSPAHSLNVAGGNGSSLMCSPANSLGAVAGNGDSLLAGSAGHGAHSLDVVAGSTGSLMCSPARTALPASTPLGQAGRMDVDGEARQQGNAGSVRGSEGTAGSAGSVGKVAHTMGPAAKRPAGSVRTRGGWPGGSGSRDDTRDQGDGIREREDEEGAPVAAGEEEEGGASVVAGEEEEEVPVVTAVGADEAPLTELQQLLVVCGQDPDEATVPCMASFLGRLAPDLRKVVKVGEGSFGEAFKHGRTVFKVVPIEGSQPMNGGPQKRAGEVCAEALVARTLSQLRDTEGPLGLPAANCTTGFVETFQVGVCTGPYAPSLVRAWHAWDQQHESENDPVDDLGGPEHDPRQRFLVIAMADCGMDLERAKLSGLDQARSLLAQVVFAIATAEAALEFEHRDLHWGNVLLRPTKQPWVSCRLHGSDMELATHGIEAAVIDFTASRLRTPSGALVFCDLSQDEELFQGPQGDIQFDSYRFMRKLTCNEWDASCLATNALWMAYLAETVLTHKMNRCTAAQKRAVREFRKRASKAASCQELVDDPLFDGLWRRAGAARIQ